jgi:hypothetical protein
MYTQFPKPVRLFLLSLAGRIGRSFALKRSIRRLNICKRLSARVMRALGWWPYSKGVSQVTVCLPSARRSVFSYPVRRWAQLPDFRELSQSWPRIFTTSYGEYAIRAFKVKRIDCLLKPMKTTDLETAITKFRTLKVGSFSAASRLRSGKFRAQLNPASLEADRALDK